MTSQQYQHMMNLRRMTLLAARANLAAGYAEPEAEETHQEAPAFQIFQDNLLVTSSNPLLISYADNNKFKNVLTLVIKPTENSNLNLEDVANIWVEGDDPDFNEQISEMTVNLTLNEAVATCAMDGSQIDINGNAFTLYMVNNSGIFDKNSGTFKVELLTAPVDGEPSLIAELDVPFKLSDDIPVWGSGQYSFTLPSYSQTPYELIWSQEYQRYQDSLTYMLLTRSGENVILNIIHKDDDDFFTTPLTTPYRPLLTGTIAGQPEMENTSWTLLYSAD